MLKKYSRRCLIFSFLLAGAFKADASCAAARTMFESVQAKRREAIFDLSAHPENQIENTVAHLRSISKSGSSKYELVNQWRDIEGSLKANPYDREEIHNRDGSVLFVGNRRGKFQFLAFSAGTPPKVFRGECSSRPVANDNWLVNNDWITDDPLR